MRKITAYTDGACNPNPGVGGWGWVYYDKTNKIPLIISDHGGLKNTTNNQMELTAMAEFLEFCPLGIYADIYSDSDYVLGGIIGKHTRVLTCVEPKPQGWLKVWVSRFSSIDTKHTDSYWSKKDVKNADEWYRIHQALLKHAKADTILNFCWVKGHSGVEGNEEADRLAGLFKKEL